MTTSTSDSRPSAATSPAAAGADDAGGVGFVDDHSRAVGSREVDDVAQGCEVAVHGEHRVGDDHRAASVGSLQSGSQRVQIAMLIDDGLGAREPAAVDDRGMVQRVGEDHVPVVGERRDHAEVGQVARPEQHAGLMAFELRQFGLELLVRVRVPETRRDAPLPAPHCSAASAAAARTAGWPASPR